MKRKACPICDQAMKTHHYCSFCKSWIKAPYEQEVHYYLNERHDELELDCDYHGKWAQASGGVPVKPPPGQTQGRILMKTPSWMGGETVSRETSETKRIPFKGKAFLMIVIFCLFLDAAGAVLDRIIEAGSAYVTSFSLGTEEETVREETAGVWEDGMPCTGYAHIPVIAWDIMDSVYEMLYQHGYIVSNEYQEINDETGTDGQTYLDAVRTIYIEQEDSAGADELQYLQVSYDSVTGELHSYISIMVSEKASIRMAADFCLILENENDSIVSSQVIADAETQMLEDLKVSGTAGCLNRQVEVWLNIDGDDRITALIIPTEPDA